MNPLGELTLSPLPGNTLATRIALSHLPTSMHAWTFASYPGDSGAAETLRQWTCRPPPAPQGLLLRGPAGAGKTGLMAAALHEALERAVGGMEWWNLMSTERYQEAVASGRLRQRPAPVWFESWGDLRDRLKRTWRPGGDDDTTASEEQLLGELEERVAVLALDDIDVDAMGDWKESVLLRLLRFPERGQRLLVATNVPLRGFTQRFGERCADRLLDPAMFLLVEVAGRSLRRRL